MNTTRLAVVIALASSACATAYTGESRHIAAEVVLHGDGWRTAPVPAVTQADENDCGAAALAMVIARWRPRLDRIAIAHAVPLQTTGYRLGDLRDIARAAGLSAFAIAGDRDVLDHELARGRAVVVGLYRPYGKHLLAHYEVVVGLHRDGRVATIDPADGEWHVRSWDGLLAEWQPAGRPALVIVGEDYLSGYPDVPPPPGVMSWASSSHSSPD